MLGLHDVLVVPARADVVAPAYLYASNPPSHNLTINTTRYSLKPMQDGDDPLEAEARL